MSTPFDGIQKDEDATRALGYVVMKVAVLAFLAGLTLGFALGWALT